MNKEPAADSLGAATVVATVVGGAAAESAFHALGVICMGAFGGALFALMKMPKMSIAEGIRFMVPKCLFSFFCAWMLSIGLERFLNDHFYVVPETALFLFVSFVLACPAEFGRELQPLFRLVGSIMRLLPKSKE